MAEHLPEPGEFKDYPPLPAGLKRFMCSHAKDDGRYGIILVGTDADQVLEDNCAELNGLTVDGECIAHAAAKPADS